MAYNVKDKYFFKAKREGYRARSALKLYEIMEKYPKFLHREDNVLDVGACPGSFMQVVLKNKAIDAVLVGVDRNPIDPFEDYSNVFTFEQDILEPGFDEQLEEIGIEGQFDTIISDLAPNTSGIKDVDQMRSIELDEMVLGIAEKYLKKKGNLLLKILVGDDFQEFLKDLKKKFYIVKPFIPKSTRDSSSEQYLVCFGYGDKPKVKPGFQGDNPKMKKKDIKKMNRKLSNRPNSKKKKKKGKK
ncbi:MAG: RlmE family RNA methyltransferase [Patescibacteria group bacterium]|nr:RlmE family RNA methyltransferase [Patescibacteria group bacterium]